MTYFRTFVLAVIIAMVAVFDTYAVNSVNVLDPRRTQYKYPSTIEEMTVSIEPQGVYTEIGMYLTFSSRGTNFTRETDTVEVEFLFDLPQEAMLNDCWLWVDNVIVRAKLIDRWTASLVYEGIVKRRQDPSILFKIGQGKYELRVFPMAGNKTRKVKISYLLPSNVAANYISTALPLNFLQASKLPPNKIQLVTTTNQEFNQVWLPENTSLQFMETDLKDFGKSLVLDLTPAQASKIQTIAFNSPLKNGVYFNYARVGKDNYYQMAMLPAKALDFTAPKKVAILVDHDAGTTDISSVDILNTIRNNLHAYFSAKDSFNLIFSNLDIIKISQTWLPADSASIEQTFNMLPGAPISSYSNMPSLLSESIDFINNNGRDGMIVLLSSSYQVGTMNIANQLIADILKKLDDNTIIHIAEYASKNLPSYKIGDRSYLGNEYFFFNLAKLTSGNYYNITKSGNNFNSLITKTFQNFTGIINSFDMHTATETGFCYARYYPNNTNQSVNYNTPIVEIGKFIGDFPFKITASGFYKNTAFSKQINIQKGDFANPEYNNFQFWVGNYIKYLETQKEQTNETVSEIIEQSMDNRVLSIYTAFLALEPSMMDTTQTGTDTTGNDHTVNDVNDKIVNDEITVSSYPNPFSISTSISVKLNNNLRGDGISIKIYDMLGQLVKQFDNEKFSGDILKLNWKGDNDFGQLLPDGTYILVISTPTNKYVLKVILMR